MQLSCSLTLELYFFAWLLADLNHRIRTSPINLDSFGKNAFSFIEFLSLAASFSGYVVYVCIFKWPRGLEPPMIICVFYIYIYVCVCVCRGTGSTCHLRALSFSWKGSPRRKPCDLMLQFPSIVHFSYKVMLTGTSGWWSWVHQNLGEIKEMNKSMRYGWVAALNAFPGTSWLSCSCLSCSVCCKENWLGSGH